MVGRRKVPLWALSGAELIRFPKSRKFTVPLACPKPVVTVAVNVTAPAQDQVTLTGSATLAGSVFDPNLNNNSVTFVTAVGACPRNLCGR